MHCPRKSSLQARRNTRFTAFYAGVENYRSDLLKGYGPFPEEDRPDSGDPAKSLTFPKRTIAVRATAFSTCRPPLALSRASRTSTAECCNGSTGRSPTGDIYERNCETTGKSSALARRAIFHPPNEPQENRSLYFAFAAAAVPSGGWSPSRCSDFLSAPASPSGFPMYSTMSEILRLEASLGSAFTRGR